jgi:hypothetical protein
VFSSHYIRRHAGNRIWLDAEYELTVSDGEKRVIGVGEVVLAEDTTGKGHITKPLGEKLAHGLFIPID